MCILHSYKSQKLALRNRLKAWITTSTTLGGVWETLGSVHCSYLKVKFSLLQVRVEVKKTLVEREYLHLPVPTSLKHERAHLDTKIAEVRSSLPYQNSAITNRVLLHQAVITRGRSKKIIEERSSKQAPTYDQDPIQTQLLFEIGHNKLSL